MELGMVGLGRMGANMTERLMQGGHSLVVYDRSNDAVDRSVAAGAVGASSLAALVDRLTVPRAIWVMVPSGAPTEATIVELTSLLSSGDTIIDGGNSNYKESVRRAGETAAKGMAFVDCGTSGGIWGLKEGYSLMIGGNDDAVERLRPIFETLAPAVDQGWGHVGPAGSGHFVKMVHNGIEYGLMQAYAEGFELLGKKESFGLDLHQIAEIWRTGSVVRSWLLDLTARALAENPELDGIAPVVPDSGEGRWTVAESIELGVPLPVITLALQNRFKSQSRDSYGDKLLSAMRNQFGGHAIVKEG